MSPMIINVTITEKMYIRNWYIIYIRNSKQGSEISIWTYEEKII